MFCQPRAGESGEIHLLCDITEIFDFWFQAPIPLVLLKKLMLVKKSALLSVFNLCPLFDANIP